MTASNNPADLRTECVTEPAELDARAAAWDALAARVPQQLPMLAHGWVSPLLEQRMEPGWTWLVAFAWRGDRLVGVLPIVVVPGRVLWLRRPRLHAPCAYNTFAGDPLLAPEMAADVLAALLKAVRSRVPRPLRLDLGCMRESSPTYACIQQGVPGWVVTRGAANSGSSIRIEGRYEDWEAKLSKSLRRDIRRGENKIARDHGGKATYEFLAGEAASPTRLDELMEIEATTWKGEEGGAIASSPAREARYRAVAERFYRHGMLEWQFLRIGDQLAAAQMVIRTGTSRMLLRMAYNAHLAKLHAGHLLLRELVRRSFEGGDVDEVNMVNDHAWCRRWNTHVERYHNMAAARRAPLPLLIGVGPRLLRAAARRIPGLKGLAARLRRRA